MNKKAAKEKMKSAAQVLSFLLAMNNSTAEFTIWEDDSEMRIHQSPFIGITKEDAK